MSTTKIMTYEEAISIEGELREIPPFPLHYAARSGRIYGYSGYHPDMLYEISASLDKRGYWMVNIYDYDKKYYTGKLVHRLIAAAYLGTPPMRIDYLGVERRSATIKHKNGNILDNRADNLEYHIGKPPKGYRTLTQRDLDKIQERLKNGEMGAVVAAEFHVSPSMISRIKNGYRHNTKKRRQTNYEPNAIVWRVDDFVLHDNDPKDENHLRMVLGYNHEGLCETVYLNAHLNKDHIIQMVDNFRYLHDPGRFGVARCWEEVQTTIFTADAAVTADAE